MHRQAENIECQWDGSLCETTTELHKILQVQTNLEDILRDLNLEKALQLQLDRQNEMQSEVHEVKQCVQAGFEIVVRQLERIQMALGELAEAQRVANQTALARSVAELAHMNRN